MNSITEIFEGIFSLSSNEFLTTLIFSALVIGLIFFSIIITASLVQKFLEKRRKQ